MKLFHLLIYAFCCASLGKASDPAGIFETMFYYYAYRIEASAFAKADRMLASQCVTATGEICTLNDFIRKIANNPGELIAAGDTTLPAVEGADVTFADMEWTGEYGGAKMNHMAMMAAVTNRIQAAREIMTVDPDLLSRAKEGLALTQELRWEENFSKVPTAFNDRFPGVTLYETETTLDGVKVDFIDWVKTGTVQASKTNSKAKVLIKRYQDWAKTQNNEGYFFHQSMLRNVAAFRNILEGVPTCHATSVRYRKSP
ncbi:hypothetical protein BO94DRAFT_551032 [Aspergillus sclerotioniger CBS 115572]|uniref:Uncharacterized protein n=1 Tax=Aspergillus sclerotioniger CBS 115572 TaxID=1450535 RepID=A0A317V5G6_9EURO|nr:hypothetical protein BO94DRAFT_551032 [Aspergillus sclerotioniger CBS 115572]PWY68531.1 hypothetical protein BO94DRAFT_551032 [Aspergillus sclerotioniger CBS 115572]